MADPQTKLLIAITGSSGLIGSALRQRLDQGGHRVLRLVRGEATGPEDRVWDPAAGRLDPAALEGVDAVVNLAGAGIGDRRWSAEQKRLLADSRVHGTTLLAETMAAMTTPPPVLLSGSAIGYYGDRGDQLLTESSEPGRSFLSQLCLSWEAATAAAEQAGVRVAHLRTGIVLDRAGGALAKMLPLFRFGLGGRMGSGRDYWSWISLQDEVEAMVFLLTNEVRGAVNLTAPNPATNAELTRALAAAVHRPALVPVPRFGPRLLLGAELADALLFTSARVSPQALLDAGYPFHHPDLASALQAALAK